MVLKDKGVMTLTIKRRLFIGSMLMIAFSLIITASTFFLVRFMMVDDTQTRGGPGGRFPDMPNVPVVDVSRADEALARGNFVHVASDVSLYHSDLGDYIIILPGGHWEAIEDFNSAPDFLLILPLVLIYLLVVTLLANLLLAKYISRQIITPINTLASGVHEISNGNLTHRIQYRGGDEFDAVCSDFNEMASHLSDMVEQRQADENSRKELIAGISHDLRTPLTSVKMCIEGIRNGVASTPEMQEKYLSTIERKTGDIEYIIKQLFVFSKMDIGEFPLNLETVNIGNELEKMFVDFVDEYKEMGLEVTLEENIQEDFVLIDIVQFKNVIQNILGNCVKYCNRNDARAEISCKKIDNHALITIKDNGSGVPDEMLIKMFDVFYRGDEARNNPAKGSGLGLAISSKIIERFGGQIRAENIPKSGLSIMITLPMQEVESHEENTDY